jgi:hypothetical protein
MKKLLIATTLVAIASMATAAEVGMSSVRDIGLDKNGVRVTASVGTLVGFTPQVSFTQLNGSYDRWAVGGQYALAKVGPVAFAATASGVYHDSLVGSDGYGVTGGLKATYALSKNVDVVAGVERFIGQDSVSASNATVTSFGLNLKF